MTMAHSLEQLPQLLPLLPGYQLPWMQQQRLAAAARFAETGFPDHKQEAWKYTHLEKLTTHSFQVITQKLGLDQQTQAAQLMQTLPSDTHRCVFIDGHFCPALSMLDNAMPHITIYPWHDTVPNDLLHTTVTETDGVEALNLAFMQTGIIIQIPTQVHITKPIHVIHVHTQANSMTHLRHVIQLDAGAKATIIEHHLGHFIPYLSTVFSTVTLAKQAQLEYYRWQEHSLAAYQLSRLQLTQANHSSAKLMTLDLGGHLIRNDIMHRFTGEHAACDMAGLYLLAQKQHVDNHLSIHHEQAHCQSSQLYKGIIDDQAHAVFHGKVTVHAHAQKTQAHQHNANLLLSDQAEIDTQPQLEIYADDVKCTHGTTVGQLDEDALFYLQSRGLHISTARDLLIYGFAADILSHLPHDDLRQYCQSRLLAAVPCAQPLFTAELP